MDAVAESRELRPFEFAGSLYRDPRQLAAAMAEGWGRAAVLVVVEDLRVWLESEVNDRSLPTNALTSGSADERLARLAAHYLGDRPPTFRGRAVDVAGLVALCADVESEDADATRVFDRLTVQLVACFAQHNCRAGHDACAHRLGCQLLATLCTTTGDAWRSVAHRLGDVMFTGLGPTGTPCSAETMEHLGVGEGRMILDPHESALIDQADGAEYLERRTVTFEDVQRSRVNLHRVRAMVAHAVLDDGYRSELDRRIRQLSNEPRGAWWADLTRYVEALDAPATLAGAAMMLELAEYAARRAERDGRAAQSTDTRTVAQAAAAALRVLRSHGYPDPAKIKVRAGWFKKERRGWYVYGVTTSDRSGNSLYLLDDGQLVEGGPDCYDRAEYLIGHRAEVLRGLDFIATQVRAHGGQYRQWLDR